MCLKKNEEGKCLFQIKSKNEVKSESGTLDCASGAGG